MQKIYIDADYAHIKDCKSMTSVILLLGEALIQQISKKQLLVVTSTAYAEHQALFAGTEYANLTTSYTIMLDENFDYPTIYYDNQATVVMANSNDILKSRAVDVKFHYVKK